jgi:hypothetical protein
VNRGVSENDSQWKCLKSFYEKAARRHEVLKSEDPNLRDLLKYKRFSWNSHIQYKVYYNNLDFTNHEVKPFIDTINCSEKIETNSIIIKKFIDEKDYSKFEKMFTQRALKVGEDAVLIFTSKNNDHVLTNEELYKIMQKLNIWGLEKG